MKLKHMLALIGAGTIAVTALTACSTPQPPVNGHPTEATTAATQPRQNGSTGLDTQNKEDSFSGPYYGTIKQVRQSSIEIELLTIGNESGSDSDSMGHTNGNDTQVFDQQAKKSDQPADFKKSGETLSTTFAPTFQISNAGKTVLDLKEGDQIAFYTSGSADGELLSIHIME